MYKEYDFDTFYKTVVFEGNSIIELTELLNILTSPEQSLTPKELKKPDFKVSTRYFYCEQEARWSFGDTDDYFYEDKERK